MCVCVCDAHKHNRGSILYVVYVAYGARGLEIFSFILRLLTLLSELAKNKDEKTLIFAATKRRCDGLAKLLIREG